MTPVQPRSRLRFLRALLRPLASPRGALGILVLAAGLGAVEVSGRHVATDVGDVGMLALTGVLILVVAALRGTDGRRLALRFDAWRWAQVARVKRLWPQVGVDFRDDPTIPHRMPRFVARTTLALGAVVVLGALWTLFSPTSLRALIAPRVYLAHLALLVLVWGGLLLSVFLGVFLAIMTARHALWLRGAPRDRGRPLLWAWLFVLLVLGALLPVEVPMLLGVAAVLLTLGMTRILRVPRLTLLWRTASDGRLAASSWAATLWQASALPMAVFVVFLGLALGGAWSWWPTPPSTTPLTDGLATVAAWCLGPSFLALAGIVLLDLRRLASSNPATPCPTTLHLALATTKDERSRVERLLEGRGWRIRYEPEAPRSTDVCLRLVDSPMPRPPRGWPLAVSARALEVPELLDLIARRDVVQRRRILRRGLQRLLKEVRARDYERGEGFWIAPHLWFVSAVTRDTEEEDLTEDGLNNELGTPYTRLFPLPVRHHLYVVLRAVEVDIILLEDGVRWSAFRRVLDRVFSHYDERRGRIEERDFSGILGVRVILHELEPGGQLEVEGYPEPDYTDLARGRILHVFRDRGGLEDETEPVPSEDTGVLVGV